MAQKKGGWFRESERHSLASKGIETGRRQKPRTPRASRAAPPKGSPSAEDTKASQVYRRLYAEEDENFGKIYVDKASGKELLLIGESIEEKNGEVILVFQLRESGELIERSPTEVELVRET